MKAVKIGVKVCDEVLSCGDQDNNEVGSQVHMYKIIVICVLFV